MRTYLFILNLCLGLVASFPVYADDVSVRASLHSDYGRLVFGWPRPVAHKLVVTENRLTLEFDRAISASYQRARGALARYITDISSDPDGRRVHIQLTDRFDAYSYDSGSAVILEIAKIEPTRAENDAAQPVLSATQQITTADPKAFAQAAEQTQNAPDIRVRTGEHDTYTRLVFDWPATVDYTFEQVDGVVTLSFKQVANLGLTALKRSPPRFVGDVESQVSEEGVRVAVAISKTSTARHFLSGPKVVVDIRAPTGDEAIARLPANLFPTETAAPSEQAEAIAPQPTSEEAPVATPEPAVNATETGSSSSRDAEQPVAAQTAEASSEPNTETGPIPLVAESREASPQAIQNASAPTANAKVSGNAGSAEQGVTLRFDWDEPVAAAVFRRVGYLWIAFDKATTVDVAGLQQAGAGMVGSVQQVPATSGTVLRMITPNEIHPSLSRDGLSWLLNFRKQQFVAKTPLTINAQPDSPVGARIFVPVPEPGAPLGVTDPDVGDNLIIVPTIPLSHGVVEPYTYPEMRILTTMQGLVVIPTTDNLRVRPLRQGIELASPDALSLSPVSPEVAAGSQRGALGPVSRVLELEKWELTEPADFIKRKQELQMDIARAQNEKDEQEARLELARFYFAHRFSAEVLGVLRPLLDVSPEIEEEAEFRLLRGGSSYLLNRFADAVEDFSHESLDSVDEGAFWRAAVIAKSGEVIAAAHELRRTGNITQQYPNPLRIEMASLVADSIVEIGDIQQAQQYIETLRALSPTINQLAEIDFIEGKLLELGGDEEGAVLKWEEVLEVDNRPTRFKATLAHMDLLMKMDRMEIEEAIEALEGLRFVWRGGKEEFLLLRKLGGLYLDQGNYRRGLLALRQAATYFRENENAPEVTQQMSDTFNFLYLDGGADTMPPVTAIALYDEFKELTPAGRKGDEMIRKLADRLVQVDLLDSAAELLQQQIEFRLEGAEKAEVGLNLALIHALAKEPEKVIATLDETEVPDLPEDLEARRRHMRAQSMTQLGETEDVLVLLKKDKSLDADLIRSEMFRGQGDWKNAAIALHSVVRQSGLKPGEPLSNDDAFKVLDLATAYTLSNNERALAKLRGDFNGAMARTDLKDAFDLVSQPLALGMIDPGSISDRVKVVMNFRTFLDKYKERLKQERLSNLARDGAIPDDAAGTSEAQG